MPRQIDLSSMAFDPNDDSNEPMMRYFAARLILEALDADGIVNGGTSLRQKPRRMMSRRYGQTGSVVLRRGKWEGRFYVDTDEGRTRKFIKLGQKSDLTRAEAKRKLMQLIADQGINKPELSTDALTTKEGATFNHAADKWERMRLPKLGLSSQYMMPKLLAKHLRPSFGKLPVESIKTGTVNEWLATMSSYEPKTVHNMYKLLRAIVNWHYRQEDQSAKKWSPDLPPLKDVEQRWFTPQETAQIVRVAEGQYKPLFHLAASTGMRAGELFGLRVEDIDFERRVIRVVRSIYKGKEVPTKTRKGYRDIFVDSDTTRVLQQYLNGRTSGLVFATRNGTPLHLRDLLANVLYRLCDNLSIKRGGMHSFRHGRVSLLQTSGAPADLIKRQVGHSSLRTTSGYTHFTDEFQQELADRLSWTQAAQLDAAAKASNRSRMN